MMLHYWLKRRPECWWWRKRYWANGSRWEWRLRSYLHDTISARHFGAPCTGSGRRQFFRHTPIPRMRATIMENGPHTNNEIVASVKKGIYCAAFSNGQVNIGGGDFAFYVKQGFLMRMENSLNPSKMSTSLETDQILFEDGHDRKRYGCGRRRMDMR